MGAMSMTEVKRRYVKDKVRLKLKINDSAMAGILRMPFKMAARFTEDSSDGFKKGIKVGPHTAIHSWRANRKRAELMLLAGDRMVVTIRANGVDDPKVVLEFAKALDLDALAKLKGEPAK